MMDRVHELVRDHLLYTGGSLYEVFKRLDTDGSSYLGADELHAGLRSLGGHELTLADAQRVLAALDENKDGKVSYPEFSALLASAGGATRVDEPGHWAYSLFEAIRRRVHVDRRGLYELFGARKPAPGSRERAEVPWASFRAALDALPARLQREQEQELRDLLGASGPSGSVDLDRLAALVGIREDAAPAHRAAAERYQALPPPREGHARRREAVRQTMRALIAGGVTPSGLRMELAVEAAREKGGPAGGLHGRPGEATLPRAAFTDALDYACDPTKRLDPARLNSIADMFLTRTGDRVDYEAFVTALASATAMEATRAYLFGQAAVLIGAQARTPDLATLLRDAARRPGAPVLTAGELTAAF